MNVKVHVRADEDMGEVNPYIYGQYFEHLGNCIYPSVSDEHSSLADSSGIRLDVVEVARELAVPVIRWPGGCFVDLYDWKDGVGPRSERPTRVNWHWGGLESNQFGTDEFLAWCRNVGAEPYVNVNLGTGTLQDALRWLDYCNGDGATSDSKNRIENGYREAHGVKLWGIGNETWGEWEAGQLSADEYAHKLANWAQFFKKYDPSLQLLGVGSSHGGDTNWDQAVVRKAGKFLDYLTFHLYACSVDRESGDEFYPIVFSPVTFEKRLLAMAESIKLAAASSSFMKPVRISMDEWNIRHCEPDPENPGEYVLNRNSPRNLQDALFAAGIFHTMIRLSPMVEMANYVFLVNGNGVISVVEDKIVRTTLFYVFKQYRAWMTGQSVRVEVSGPSMLTPPPLLNWPRYTDYIKAVHEPKEAAFADVVAVRKENGDVNIAIVNRHRYQTARMQLTLPEGCIPRTTWQMTHTDMYATNTVENPTNITPSESEVTDVSMRDWEIPAHSIMLIHCEAERASNSTVA